MLIYEPETLPDALKILKGKTFQFLVCIEKENLWDGLETYKVSTVLSKHGMLAEEHTLEESDNNLSHSKINSENLGLEFTSLSDGSQDDLSPPSKRYLDLKEDLFDQSSITKRKCVQSSKLADLVNVSIDKRDFDAVVSAEDEGFIDDKNNIEEVTITNGPVERRGLKPNLVRVKVEPN
ncbi:PREDICTED: uncharacterized protein LOC104707456 isoform X1 [Camelina sativa]|uniref:Uncharacterized protein LOC104707456 isoform X1 n=1 Tax=Camelina sativa TaxID=90675 RepID=A0ABM1QD47_CAMSA|nr:PREDICTED: uncharacterized protein LOC104707456 isoform X1 [Camelina sativa]